MLKKWVIFSVLVFQFLLVGYKSEDVDAITERDMIQTITEDVDTEEDLHFGWYQDEEEDWFYYDQQGNMLTGWQFIDGYWFYLDAENTEKPGVMLEDCKEEIDGKMYFFDEYGVMLTGWRQYQEGWYYLDNSGVMQTDWNYIGNEWYYLDGDNEQYPGLMVSDCSMVIEGEEYLFYASGVMHRGWYELDGEWYYYNQSGYLCTGWQYVGNYWFYLDAEDDNRMVSACWKIIDGQWYFFHSDGNMATKWLQRPEGWYYMAEDGAMRTGWHMIDGRWYYFYYKDDVNGGSEGLMAHSRNIEGCVLSASGAMVTGEELDMTARAQIYSSNTMYLLMVDLNNCRVGVFSGSLGNWTLMNYWLCSPGKASTPTVRGQFTVGSKGYYFDSGASRCFWYTQFYNDYLFHSVLYNRNGTLQDGRLGMHLSHGCVRMEISNAKWIYDNIPRGTKVVVY